MKKDSLKNILFSVLQTLLYPFIFIIVILIVAFGLSFLKVNENTITSILILILVIYIFALFYFSKPITFTSIIYTTIPFTLIASPLITYAVFLYMKANTNLPIIGSDGDWISFIGSVIGGSITVIAVAFTILHERNTDKQNRSIRLLPTFEVSHIYKDEDNNDISNLDSFINKIKIDYGSLSIDSYKEISSIYTVKNLSSNLIRELKIKKCTFWVNEHFSYEIEPKYNFQNVISKNIMFDILRNDIYSLLAVNYSNVMRDTAVYGKLIVILEYYDINKSLEKPYIHEFTSDLKILIREESCIDEDGNTLVKDNLKIQSLRTYNTLNLNMFNNLKV